MYQPPPPLNTRHDYMLTVFALQVSVEFLYQVECKPTHRLLAHCMFLYTGLSCHLHEIENAKHSHRY